MTSYMVKSVLYKSGKIWLRPDFPKANLVQPYYSAAHWHLGDV